MNRLRELDGKFVGRVTTTGLYHLDSSLLTGAQGVRFQCPRCSIGLPIVDDPGRPGRRYVVGAHYIEVLFSNPCDVEPAPADAGVTDGEGGHPRWSIESGDSLDNHTLTPSINCDIPWKDKDGVEHPSSCKFHGYVKNGEAG